MSNSAPTYVVTLKKPILVQTKHPIHEGQVVNIQVRYLRYNENNRVGIVHHCHDVGWLDSDTKALHWFRTYYGVTGDYDSFTIETPDQNIEGRQIL